MSSLKYALCCAVAVALAVVALAPARSLTTFAGRLEGVALHDASGFWWRGNADAALLGISVGVLSWRFDPLSLFLANLRFDWRLLDADLRLAGSAGVGFGGAATIRASGEVAAVAINQVLADYHIRLPGTFHVDGLVVGNEDDRLAVAGTLKWNGGPTSYRLSGRIFEVDLPPMVAELEVDAGKPTLTVRAVDDRTRLLVADLDAEGWLRVGVTKRMTMLAGKPWRGAGADGDVVVSVQEKVAPLARRAAP